MRRLSWTVLVLSVLVTTGVVLATGSQLRPRVAPLATRLPVGGVMLLAVASWVAFYVRFRRPRTCMNG